jgi:drug/metabolite transporter (DMT)-like permease
MKNSQTNQASFWRSDAALIMLALVWGTSHVIQKDILSSHSPAFYTSARFGIAALCFGLLFGWRLRRSPRKELVKGAWLGLFSFAGIAFYTSGLAFTQASNNGALSGLHAAARLSVVPLASDSRSSDWARDRGRRFRSAQLSADR